MSEYKEGRGGYYLREGLREENERLTAALAAANADAEALAEALRDFAGDYSSGPKDSVRAALAAHDERAKED